MFLVSWIKSYFGEDYYKLSRKFIETLFLENLKKFNKEVFSQIREFIFLGEGSFNIVYRISPTQVLRICKISSVKEHVVNEYNRLTVPNTLEN